MKNNNRFSFQYLGEPAVYAENYNKGQKGEPGFDGSPGNFVPFQKKKSFVDKQMNSFYLSYFDFSVYKKIGSPGPFGEAGPRGPPGNDGQRGYPGQKGLRKSHWNY